MSSITKKWTEEDFRRELRAVDAHVKKTQGIELEGGELEIRFTNGRRILGQYFPQTVSFAFSLAFFNSDVPEECAIDVIRHEYAHYYSHVVYASRACHDLRFKAACRVVGANPEAYYSHRLESSAREREARRKQVYQSKVSVGQEIRHPLYGKGKVVAVENQHTTAHLQVDFGKHGLRRIEEAWLRKNGGI